MAGLIICNWRLPAAVAPSFLPFVAVAQKQKANQAAEYAKQIGDNELLKSVVEKKDEQIQDLKSRNAELQTQMQVTGKNDPRLRCLSLFVDLAN